MLSAANEDGYAFGEWLLDPGERRLARAGAPVEVSSRYLDALLLLVANGGALITKDRFMDEVWRGVPVTDEALTQCIRTLRRLLGDDAARPRFIETVPKHGYRFVARVRTLTHDGEIDSPRAQPSDGPEGMPRLPSARTDSDGEMSQTANGLLVESTAGLAGGAVAGLGGGLLYGLLAASAPPAGTGAISVLLVMTCLCLLIGILAGAGVGFGIAAARRVAGGRLFPVMLGGALGGLLIGTIGRLVGLDAFALLIGSHPLAITGGGEGLVVGALTGAGVWLVLRDKGRRVEKVAATSAACGAVAGLLVVIGGGKMMAGSLAVLAAAHPQAPLGALLGPGGAALPAWAMLLTGAVEGATFAAALALAFSLALRRRAD